jgi:alpha,alpha-trehalase
VPCADDRFQELYYWDTYYANLGLLRSGRTDQAKNNVDNFLYEIETYGFIPNSNATYHLNRSQPPHLSLMIRDIYDVTGDIDWVRRRLDTLEKEYRFWMQQRLTPVGLNRHYHRASDEEKLEFYDHVLVRRLGIEDAEDEVKREIADHYIAEAETGHDFTPRFGGRCADCAPVDLNSLLACYENNFCYFAERTNWGDPQRWEDAWTARRRLMDELLWDGSRYADYNYVTQERSPVTSVASLFPLWAGLATNEQAASMVSQLQALDEAHGIVTCVQIDEGPQFQWGYPSGWPPMQYAVVAALRRYGYEDRARHVSGKYLDLVSAVFRKTGSLWEKYDVVSGTPAAGEYEATRMLGWTAGVFLALYEVAWE